MNSSSALNIQCFKGILTREYDNNIIREDEYMNPESISMIFNSVSSTLNFENNMDQIEEQLLQILEKQGPSDDYDKIVVYYYRMLVERYERLKKVEEPLESFFFACNKYLTNKKIKYIPNDFKYEIVIGDDENKKRTIALDHLSSGEKQLVSLFNYIYLSIPDKCMVIIDEPELSLSADWQEQILEDLMASGKCGALIAATQSPFVYNNSLRKLAKPIGIFISVE